MNTMKRKIIALLVISVYLILILITTSACSTLNTSKYTIDGDYVYFGSYPQSSVDKNISALRNIQNSKGYYWCTDKKFHALVSYYTINSRYLVGYNNVIINNFNANAWEVHNGLFNIEPIKWRILQRFEDRLVLVSDKILDSKAFSTKEAYKNDNGEIIYPHSYYYSEIREWLINDFLNTAFTEAEQELIMPKTIIDDFVPSGFEIMEDKIFLLDSTELQLYCQGSKVKESTAYSRANGVCRPYGDGNCTGAYFLRDGSYLYGSDVDGKYYVNTVYTNGSVFPGDVTFNAYGVVPALVLNIEDGNSTAKINVNDIFTHLAIFMEQDYTVPDNKKAV